jgi:predicted ATPase/DNA-binding CsgD family transcriptional regulator
MIGHPVMCPAFIGRHDELVALDDARRGLRKSHGSIVLIGGDPGIGKTRLLAEFVRRSSDVRGRTRVHADCLQSAQQPFGPVRTFARALVRDADFDALPASVLRALAQLVPSDLPAALRDAIGPVELGNAELFAALLDFFRIAAAKRLTVLTIEDVHWSDPSTLAFLAYAAPRIATARLLIVATYRSDLVEPGSPLAASLVGMTREPSVRDLRLEPLSPEQTRTLIDGALETHAKLSSDRLRDIERRSEGNPFFAEELLKSALAWRERKLVLPLSIRATITERLALVSEDDRAVLAQAAALGYRFDPLLLAAIADRPIAEIAPALRRARDLNVLVEEDDDRVRYRFRHALTHQAIYDDALAFDRRRLHERILTVLEALESDGHLEELAYHAAAAKIPAKVVAYNERAGERAFGLRALAEAATCFERALEAATDDGDVARLRERVGTVAQQQGRLRASVDAFEAAYDGRMRRREYDDAARLLTSAVGDRSNLGDEGAMALVEPFLEEFGDRISRAERERMIALCGRFASAAYDFARANRLFAMLEDPGTLAPRARQNYLIAKLNERAVAGDADAWQAVAYDLLALCHALPQMLAAIALVTIAQTGIYLGTNRTIETALDRAEATLADGRYGAIVAFAAAVRGVYLAQRGMLRDALVAFDLSHAGADTFIARLIAARAAPLVAIAIGERERGERYLADDVVRNVREGEIVGESGLVLAARALWFRALGRPDEARADARLALTNRPPELPQMGAAYVAAARLLEIDELAGIAETVAAWADAPDAARRASAALVGAVIADRRGDRTEARRSGDDAARAFRSLGWAYAEAQAFEIAGRADEAIASYERCGAAGDVARLRPERAPAGEAPVLDGLTAREREIAGLVTEGLTNVAIASHLALAEKTVEKNLSAIFVKLGIRSRAQIAAFVVRSEVSRTKT